MLPCFAMFFLNHWACDHCIIPYFSHLVQLLKLSLKPAVHSPLLISSFLRSNSRESLKRLNNQETKKIPLLFCSTVFICVFDTSLATLFLPHLSYPDPTPSTLLCSCAPGETYPEFCRSVSEQNKWYWFRSSSLTVVSAQATISLNVHKAQDNLGRKQRRAPNSDSYRQLT